MSNYVRIHSNCSNCIIYKTLPQKTPDNVLQVTTPPIVIKTMPPSHV